MVMTMADQRKLTRKGFTLFRLELREKKIKWTREPGCWMSYQKYPTQTQCRKAWNSLMLDNLYIEA